MNQILQHLGSGDTLLAEVPSPVARAGSLLIRTRASLVSIGTEKMLIDFGRAGWIDKARKQPDKVRQVLDKIKTDGLFPTIEAVRAKLDQPIALGYANVGSIMDTGAGVQASEFRAGDRVVSNGPHAEVVCIPANLCARVPDSVPNEEAAFTVVGAIGLQGIRLLQPTLGESFVVTGLGLIGLLCVQILRAHGCRVLGIDFDSTKCGLASKFGAETVDLSKGEDPIGAASSFSKGRGMDGVLITASTQSNEPVHQAALMCRKRGRIVLVGVVGLELSRADFYEKELSFQVSCSYGPGRYDESYEQKGQDYPLPFVRWTEQRNFEAVLDMLADRRIDARPLISHRFPFDQALRAYETIGQGKTLGIVLEYSAKELPHKDSLGRIVNGEFRRTVELPKTALGRLSKVVIGVIGAGNFTGQVLLPALKRTEARLKSIASAAGVSGTHLGKKFGFELSTTDTETIFQDPEINTIIVSTRHNTHARFVREALHAGKHVYVEKPLCLDEAELDAIKSAIENRKSQVLMVGFNRRFSSHTIEIKKLLSARREPLCLSMTINAGAIPADHWTQDPERGGGRIIGEACHFIDLLSFLCGAPVSAVSAMMVGAGVTVRTDKMSVQLSFADGSIGTVNYFANGSKSYPKESLEVFSSGRVIRMENFQATTGWGFKGSRKFKTWRQDKGHDAELAAFVERVAEGGESPIPFSQLENVMRASFAAMESAATGKIVTLA